MGQTTIFAGFVPPQSSASVDRTVPSHPRPVRNYAFADTVRFISIAAIVFMHSIGFETSLGVLPKHPYLLFILIQCCKFGTIGFFLISGFLMAESLSRVVPLAYLRRRLRNVAFPWLLWFALFSLLRILYEEHSGQFQNLTLSSTLRLIFQTTEHLFLDSSYWFIPNLMVSLCVILLLRRFLFDIRFGCVLLLLSLFYGINIYLRWIATAHTEAIFGFVFYLWLGAFCWRKYDRLQAWLDRVPMTALLVGTVSLGVAAFCEGLLLERLSTMDTLNTLRITNQAFSIGMVLVIAKIGSISMPKGVNVRRATFGIYLVHPIVLDILKYGIQRALNPATSWFGSSIVFYTLGLTGFVFTYVASLGTSQFLADSRYSWLVGQKSATRPG